MKEFIKKILAMFQPAQIPPPAEYVEVKQQEPKPEPVKQEVKQEKQNKPKRPKQKQEVKSNVVTSGKTKKSTQVKTESRRKAKPNSAKK